MRVGGAILIWLAVTSVAPAPIAAQEPAEARPLTEAETRERNLRAYTELLRGDVRAQKIALITELMRFSDAEDAAFWPLYREYEQELTRINDARLRGIVTYAKTYDRLTDAVADELVTQAFDLEARRLVLKQTYFTKLKKAMSPVTAARVMQIEQQILLLVDLEVAATLPVIERTVEKTQ